MPIPLGTAHLPAERIGPAGRRVHRPRRDPFVEEALRWLGAEAGIGRPSPAFDERVGDPPESDGVAAPARGRGSSWPTTTPTCGTTSAAARRPLRRRGRPRRRGGPRGRPGGPARPRAHRRDDAAARRLRAPRGAPCRPRTRAIPVILLSARAGEEARVEGLEAGADDYLIKPFSARELLARVSAAIELARVRREAAAAEERAASILRTRNERLTLLWEAAGVLLSTEEPDVMLRGLFNKVSDHLGLDAYLHYMVDPARTPSRGLIDRRPGRGRSLPFAAQIRRGPLRHGSPDEDSARRHAPGRLG